MSPPWRRQPTRPWSTSKNSLAATLKPLNIKAWTDIDIKAGHVKLYVPDPTVISAATLAGTVKLSPLVDVLKPAGTGGEREASIEGGRGINANGNLCTLGSPFAHLM